MTAFQGSFFSFHFIHMSVHGNRFSVLASSQAFFRSRSVWNSEKGGQGKGFREGAGQPHNAS